MRPAGYDLTTAPQDNPLRFASRFSLGERRVIWFGELRTRIQCWIPQSDQTLPKELESLQVCVEPADVSQAGAFKVTVRSTDNALKCHLSMTGTVDRSRPLSPWQVTKAEVTTCETSSPDVVMTVGQTDDGKNEQTDDGENVCPSVAIRSRDKQMVACMQPALVGTNQPRKATRPYATLVLTGPDEKRVLGEVWRDRTLLQYFSYEPPADGSGLTWPQLLLLSATIPSPR